MVTEARQVAPVSTAWNGREAGAQVPCTFVKKQSDLAIFSPESISFSHDETKRLPALFHHAPSDGLVEDDVPLVNMAHCCANRVVQRLKIPRPGNTGKQEVGILQDSSGKRLVD